MPHTQFLHYAADGRELRTVTVYREMDDAARVAHAWTLASEEEGSYVSVFHGLRLVAEGVGREPRCADCVEAGCSVCHHGGSVAATKYIVTRQRPDDNAPSLSLGFSAANERGALRKFTDRYGAQPVGTRVTVRPQGTDRLSYTAAYVKRELGWEQTYSIALDLNRSN